MKTQDFMWGTMNSGAIFGRYKQASVVFEGTQAYTDGKVIVVPSLPHDVEMSQEQVNAARGYLDHEAGHIRHTDFDALAKMVRAAEIENHKGLRELHNCFEDIWLERRVMNEYVGSERNLSATWRQASKGQLAEIEKQGMPEFKVSHGMVAMTNIGRESYSSDYLDQILKHVDPKVAEYTYKWAEEVHKCQNTQEVIELTKSAYKILKELEEGKEPSMEPYEMDYEQMMTDGQDFKLGDYPETKEEQESFEVVSVKGGHEAAQEGKKLDGKPDKDGKSEIPGGFTPWDGESHKNYRVHSTERDEVFTKSSSNKRETKNSKAIKQTDPLKYDEIKSGVSAYSNVMKTKLRRALMSRERRDWDFGREHGKLDTKRLVPAYNRQKNVFKKRTDREELDTAVNLLVDLSGSMHGRTTLAAQAVVAFCECLEGSGISYQVTGFSTGNRYGISDDTPYHRVGEMNYYIFKEFGEPLRSAKGAIAAISNGAENENADRCAIEWAASELMKRKESRKVLFVFSDGQPACGTNRVSYESLRDTLKDGVDQVHKKGIQTVGIGIQSDSVKGLYQQYKVVHDLADLTNSTFDQLSKAILDGRIVK